MGRDADQSEWKGTQLHDKRISQDEKTCQPNVPRQEEGVHQGLSTLEITPCKELEEATEQEVITVWCSANDREDATSSEGRASQRIGESILPFYNRAEDARGCWDTTLIQVIGNC